MIVEVSEKVTVIAGRYQLDSLIGEGGMASVWRAKDRTLQRPVAVKLLFARDDRDKQALVDQFLREARIAAAVQHRNVIHIVDFGTTDEEQPFMVMELLDGETLGQRLHRERQLPLADVLHVANMTLRGLTAVHEAKIIHRDLKPDNIFLHRDASGGSFPKILDFGISRSIEPSSGRRSALTTKEGIIVGTPEYMSPEQARGLKNIDKRTDLYSMGVIMYEALTGRLPFASENVGDLIIQIVTATAPTVHELDPSIPLPISNVIEKAMARSTEDRFQDATEMQQALLEAADATVEGGVRRSLSDTPPPISGPQRVVSVRASEDRLRTLEFDMDAGPSTLELDLPGPIAAPPPAAGAALPPTLAGRPKRRGALWIGLAAAALAAFLGARALTPGGESDAAGQAEPIRVEELPLPAAAPPPAPEPAPVPEPAPTVVTVQLRNVPKHAHVTVDGEPAAGDTVELPADGKNRVIKVTAPGKTPWQVVHHSSADATYDVWLADAARKPRTESASSGRTQRKPRPRTTKSPSALRKLDF